MDFKIEPFKVYVKTDTQNRIIDINSSAFIKDLTNWIEIDSGFGDKYHHAQSNYFEEPIIGVRGIYIYKLVDNLPVERTQEEIDADIAALPSPQPSMREELIQLKEQLAAYEIAYTQGVNEI